MTDIVLPPVLETILNSPNPPEAVFRRLLPALVEVLQCDRCFLYLRHPQTSMGRVAFCWCRSPEYPEVLDAEWKPDPQSLPQEDPLFAAALRAEPSIFVEDVETASPSVLNKDFERENFGHRALIHAHLRSDGQLWGILQPCVFDRPRIWTDFDRRVIAAVIEKITPMAIDYVQSALN